MKTLIAYHGKDSLKSAFLEQIGLHEKADRVKHVGYAEFKKNGVDTFIGGCAIGCSLESMRVIEGLPSIAHSDHALYERYLGVPIMLARLEDRIFEGMPVDESIGWPRRFSEAIHPGADLSMVGWRFLHNLISDQDGAVQRRAAKNARVQKSVDAVAALFVRWFDTGTKPSVKEWREARAAAAAAAYAYAYAVDAAAAAYAYAAADAAAAAYAYAAADAAASAAASAASAADAAAARASRSQEFSHQAAVLERLLREAPMAVKA